MADNFSPISKELIDEMKAFTEATLKAIEATEKLLTSGVKLVEANNKLSTSEENSTNKKQKLTAVEQEAERIRKQQLQTHAKLDVARSKAVVALTKSKLELQKINKETKDNIIVNNSAKGSYDQLNAELRQNISRYKSLSPEQIKSKTNGIALKNAIIAQQKAIMRVDSELLVHNRNVGNYGSALKGVAGNLLGAFGVIGGVTAFAAIIKSSVSTIVKYSSQNSQLASILGKTKAEIDDLIKSSLEYGRTTQFTSTQVSQLQTELAKLGFTQKEILSSTEAILNLSAATGSELGDAARVAGAALRAMGLEASEMDRVASVLAVSTTKTAASFRDFDGNLSTILPVARAFNFSIEDSVALFGKLRDSGFDASSAATATRNILLNLADANGKLAKEIGKPVDNFDQMIDALVKLDSEGFNLGETLELTTVKTVAAFSQFVASAEDARTLRNSLIDVNDELNTMVETRMDNAEKAAVGLGSAWSGLILKLKESDGVIADVLRSLTGVINFFTGDDILKASKEGAGKVFDSWKEQGKLTADFIRNQKEQLDKELEILTQKQNTASITEKRGLRLAYNERLSLKDALNNELERLNEEELKNQQNDLAKRFDIENKSVEDLKKLQTSFSSFTSGEMKRNADLILPLIEEQLKQRKALEREANKEIEKDRKKSAVNLKKEKAKQAIEIEGFEKIVTDNQERNAKERLDSAIQFEKDVTKATQDGADARKFISDEEAKERKENQKLIRDAAIDLTAQAAQGISDVLFEASAQRRDEELEKLSEQRDEDLERLNTEQQEDLQAVQDKLDLGLINEDQAAARRNEINDKAAKNKEKIDDEADRKAAALKTKQAKADKSAALISVAIDTAVAVAKIWAQTGVFGTIAQLTAIAAGAIQAGIILATPIPKFAKGTDSTPSGSWIAGEAGSEAVITPSGQMFLTPDKPTLYSNKPNHQVIPHAETQRMLAELGMQRGFEFSDNGIRYDLQKLIKVSKKTNSSKRIDDVTYTTRGRRKQREHQSFLDSMKS